MPDWYREKQKIWRVSQRDSIIFEKLVQGPSFYYKINDPLPRDELVKEVRRLIMPDKQSRGYSLIVGEHGTGKSSLIQLAINELKLPKGIVYLTIPNTDDVDVNPLMIVETLREAFGWTKDEADRLGATATLELLEAFRVFSNVALKYQTAFQEIPVLIIDNSNRLPSTALAQFQDFGKEAADEGIAKLVFVSSEGRVEP
jgi:MoxR-like ATPase